VLDVNVPLGPGLQKIPVAMAVPFDACENPLNAEELVGKIALVGRGHCNFTEKVLAMQQANARAVVVMDSDSRGIDNSSHF
jgi:hypothetical protein